MNKTVASIYPCPFDQQIRHELNSAIYHNGNLYAYEEAKISTIKNDGVSQFPERSLLLGLKELKIRPKDIKTWILPKPKRYNQDSMYLFFSFLKAYNGKKNDFKKWIKKSVKFIKHHDLHVYHSIGSSNKNKGIYLSIDGGGDNGDNRNTTWGTFNKRINLKEYGNLRGLNGLANFHAFITEYCGFRSENGKTSGLSAYGKNQIELSKKLKKVLKVNKNGISFDRKRFNKSKVKPGNFEIDSYDRVKIFRCDISKTNISQICEGYLPQDIAFTAEKIISEYLISFLKRVKKDHFTNLEDIVFSGGLFLNVKINNDIEKSLIFKNCFFPMAPSDSGLSLGGLFSQRIKVNKKYFSKNGLTPLIGPSFKKQEIIKIMNAFNLSYNKPLNLSKDIAKEIKNQNIIGTFNGRAEFGQRSLGSRSILADPRNKNSKNKINQKIKRRDWFMPFAPAVLDTKYQNYFKSNNPSMYMQLAEEISKKFNSVIPSAIHCNNTCRVQYVDKKIFPFFWKIIYEFNKLTSIPMVLNTSFNRHGISTIASPRQAIEHLLEGNIDILYLDDFKITLKQNRIVKKNIKQNLNTNEKLLLKIFNKKWFAQNESQISDSNQKLFKKFYKEI